MNTVSSRSPWRHLAARGMLGVGMLAMTVAVGATCRGVHLNVTPSLPLGFYQAIGSEPVTRGTLVLACLPPWAAQLAREREYVPRGTCPGHVAPIGKIVAAVAGDTVTTTAAGLRVNGQAIPCTAPRATDTRGRSLPHQAATPSVVPDGAVWLISQATTRGFDSRYFGAVATTAIRARLRPLWTTGIRTTHRALHLSRRFSTCQPPT